MTVGRDRLRPEVREFVDILAAVFPDVGVSVTDAVEARRIMDASLSPFGRPKVGGVADRMIPGPPGAPDLPVRVYRPLPEAGPGPWPTVVFFHGGGWVLGGLNSHDRLCRQLCRDAGAVVVAVDYRLAPEVRFPVPIEDAYAAVCWAGDHIGELGGDPRALVVAGDSAGGNLATSAMLVGRERGGPDVALQVLIYPATDAALDTESHRTNAEGYYLTADHVRWFRDLYLGPDGDIHHPLASPLRAELAGLPAAHIVTAGCDPVCDEGRAYAKRLAEAGVPVTEAHYPGMFHGFLALSNVVDEAKDAMAGVAEVIAATMINRKPSGDHEGEEE
ncbi:MULTISPECIES: alpha/beta hydrolase [unclassified Streptomyces]|uniref:alpha/beta hydrolase n=1 Tax=unclassified Streptomyces TaxID=2593676 RepID=UPI003317FB59